MSSNNITKTTLESFRDAFPALKNLIFLNSAGMSPLPDPCRLAMNGLIEDIGKRAYLNMDNWIKTIALARKNVSELIGAFPEEVAFIKNTSAGVSLVASGLNFSEGDEVVINDIEFPSNVYPWLYLKNKGVKIVLVKSEKGRIAPEAIKHAVTPRTKVVAISSVQYISGYRAELAKIGEICRANRSLFFVDAIQSLGVIPMDVKSCGIDFLSTGGFKWLCGPTGIGIFYCNKTRLDNLTLNNIGWNTVINSQDYSNILFEPKPDAMRFEEGSPNIIGIYGLNESIKLLKAVGIANIERHVLELTDYLVERLLSMNFIIFSPRKDGEKSGIVTFSTKEKEKLTILEKKLFAENILVVNRGNGIRVSVHGFNNMKDIDRLIEVCQGVSKQVI
ncbi:MAG TPA: aminotransferase class V-fold PLP-dependent enzyme [Nitrospinota bacterium]|nr:aminotransferase [Anaerolineaceae bacterium]HJM83573.1 aminotransferase class V-fold PLP-dependent enzyme [Nitrospinota bacterium]|tara:strand:+ start:1661 stop:2830 length:1170 start_codon:yes stop_codon:yes gene_type:complete